MPHRHLKVRLKNPEPNETSDFDSGIGPYYYDFWYPVTKAEYVEGLRNGSKWFDGTSITASTSPIPEGLDVSIGDYYLNSNTWDIWECISTDAEAAARWSLVGNIKGADGTSVDIKPDEASCEEEGDGYISDGTGDYAEGHLIILTDTTTIPWTWVDAGLIQGPAGEDGATWNSGTYVGNSSHTTPFTSTTLTESDVKSGDYYLNSTTYDVYKCTAATNSNSSWSLVCNIRGATGNTGNTGATGNGIISIEGPVTVGLNDTYTINFTNGNSTTFTVTNGADGTSIGRVAYTGGGTAGQAGQTDIYTVYSDETPESPLGTFVVYNGANGTGSGTVTSVGLSMPNIFNVAGSPIENNGTLTVSLTNQNGKKIFGYNNNSTGTPSFIDATTLWNIETIGNDNNSTGLLKKTAADAWILDTNTYLTSHQTLYNLTLQLGGSTSVTYQPNVASNTFNVPVYNNNQGGGIGLVPSSNSVERQGNYYLKADGTWSTPTGGTTVQQRKHVTANELYPILCTETSTQTSPTDLTTVGYNNKVKLSKTNIIIEQAGTNPTEKYEYGGSSPITVYNNNNQAQKGVIISGGMATPGNNDNNKYLKWTGSAFTWESVSGNVQSNWNATSGDAVILNKPDLANVATSGDYNDLNNTPTIPAGIGGIEVNNSGHTSSITTNGNSYIYALDDNSGYSQTKLKVYGPSQSGISVTSTLSNELEISCNVQTTSDEAADITPYVFIPVYVDKSGQLVVPLNEALAKVGEITPPKPK